MPDVEEQSRSTSDETVEQLSGYGGTKLGVRFQDPRDIRQVFLAFAGPWVRVQGSPNLPLHYIRQARDRQGASEHRPWLGSFDELEVSRIGLNLNPQVRIGNRNVQAMRETLESIPLSECALERGQLIHRDDEIEVEADERLHVGVDRLTTHDTVGDVFFLQKRNKRFEKIGVIHRDGFPELNRLHNAF